MKRHTLFLTAGLLFMVGFSGTARGEDGDLDLLVRTARDERVEGCWPQAEAKLLFVMSRTRTGETNDDRARAMSELAQLCLDRGDFPTGEALAREALEAAQSGDARAGALRALIVALFRSGRRDSELSESIEAIVRLANDDPNDLVSRALSTRWEASLALARGKSTEALSLLRMADKLWASSEPFSVERAKTMGLQCVALKNLNDPRAVDVGEEARTMLERLAPEGFDLSQTLNNLAIARNESGDPNGALDDFRRALEIRERLAPGSEESAKLLQNLSSLFRLSGDFVGAEEAARKALSLLSGAARITPLERLRQVLEETGRYSLETEVLCERDDLIEAQSSLTGVPESARQVLRSWEGQLTSQLGAHFVRFGLADTALDAIERARSRSFLYAHDAARHRTLDRDSKSEEKRRLRELYEAAQSRLANVDARAQRAAGDDSVRELFRLGTQLERLEVASLPEARRTSRRTIPEIRDSLDDGTLALVFQQGSIVVAVRRDAPVFAARLSLSDQELDRRIDRFRRLATRSSEGKLSAALFEEGRELACELLSPVLHLLSEARRLVICADSFFLRVPFPALVVGQDAGVPIFLGERFPISHSPSLTARLTLRRPGIAARDTHLWSIGDPETGSAALPGAREEARSVAFLHPGPIRVLLGGDAQETVVKGVPPSVGTLHFACHASSNARNPEDSALLLASSAEGSPDNGQLRAWEIANEMSVNADLVVLSACTSSSALDTATEGPLGLARAFQIAGARRVLAARWRVPDEPTALFMEAFYSARARGLAADRCLQEAQVALRSNPETAHPYYWAGFVLHGDGR